MKSRMFRSAAPAAGDRRPSPGPRARHQRPARLLAAAATVAAALVLAACSSGGSGSASGSASPSSGAKLTVADVAPFSGPDAALGPTYLASCYGATSAINAAGGVLGHMLTCKSVDTRGDPADAVPAVNQMFASTPNPALVGCRHQAAPSSTATRWPVLHDLVGRHALPAATPPTGWCRQTSSSPTRSSPRSSATSASTFGNDIGSQTFIQPAIAALEVGRDHPDHQPVAGPEGHHLPDRGGGVVESHPDAIMTEALGSADPHAVLRDQAAQRRQDHPDHRHLGGHLAFAQVLGRGRGRERVLQQLPRRQPGGAVERPGLARPSPRRCCRRGRARFPAPPATSPPT